MKTNPSYKLLRGKHVVFVLREYQTGTEFIALPRDTTDADAERIAQGTSSGDWRKVETINFGSIQSNTVPDSPHHLQLKVDRLLDVFPKKSESHDHENEANSNRQGSILRSENRAGNTQFGNARNPQDGQP